MEGDAGTRQLNPTDADETPDESVAVSTESGVQARRRVIAPAEEAAGARRPSRLGSGWLLGMCAVLVVLAAGRPPAATSRCATTTKVRPSRAARRRPCRRPRIAWRQPRHRTPPRCWPARRRSSSARQVISVRRPRCTAACWSTRTRRRTSGAGVGYARRGGAAQRRWVGGRAGGRSGQGDQHRGRGPGAGIPAAGPDGSR